MAPGGGSQLVDVRALVHGDAVRIEILLQVGRGPGLEGAVFRGVGGFGEVGGGRCVAGSADFGGFVVGLLGLFDEFVAGGAGFVGGFVVEGGEVVPGYVSIDLIPSLNQLAGPTSGSP
jgi:hypothetical protein